MVIGHPSSPWVKMIIQMRPPDISAVSIPKPLTIEIGKFLCKIIDTSG
jgi:hypothetical protein